MIKLKSLHMSGHMRIVNKTNAGIVVPPVLPPDDGPLSTRSHQTNSVLALHQPTMADFVPYARPGTTWYAQVARWTTPYETDVNEYAIEPGAIEFYLNNKLLPFDGVSAYQSTIGDLVQAITRVPGWTAQISYAEDNASDPVLVLAYTAGAQPMAGLQIAYPQDSKGQFGPHPAVEIFHNGAWRHGAPVNGNLQPLTPADYAFKKWDFAGGSAEYDETGGRGPTGEPGSTETTRQNVTASGPTYPSLVSVVGGLTDESLATELGLPASDFTRVAFTMYDSEGSGQSEANFTYSNTTTISEVLSDLNYFDFAYANLDEDGHLVLANISPAATNANAFVITQSEAITVFGQNTPIAHYMQSFNNSTIRYTSSTLLAPFAAKGILEIAVYVDDENVDTVGFISGKGAPLQAGQNALVTMADLLAAINASSTGVAYLEEGRLVVGTKNVIDSPTTMLFQRYVDAELVQGQALPFHSAANLLFGAVDYRGASFTYDDQFSSVAANRAFNRMIFEGPMIPAQQTYAAYDPTFSAPVKLGTRVVNSNDLLSTYYPVGYLLEPYHSVYQNRYQLAAIEINSTNTIRDMMNYLGTVVGTLRMVEADGTHNSVTGLLRYTGLGAEIIWSNPANGQFGLADRFFVNNGEGNAAPTNPIV